MLLLGMVVNVVHLVSIGLVDTADAQTIPTFTVASSTSMPFRAGGTPVSVWSNDALVRVNHSRSAMPVFEMFDRSGQKVREVKLTLSGAGLINIYSGRFARGADGSLAVTGSAYTEDDRGASFLTWISADGREQTVSRISPFAGNALTVAHDGSIWIAGREIVDGKDLNPQHHILRRFNKTGQMIGSYLSKSDLSPTRDGTHPTEYSYLASSPDRIGWYSVAAGVYIEVSTNGTIVNRYTIAEQQDRFAGLALCGDGRVYASTVMTTAGKTAWGIYSLDRERSIWTLIPRSEKWGMLYGCQDGLLASTTDGQSIIWLKPNN